MRRNVVRSHEDLEVWKLAMRLTVDVYRTTAQLPSEERFGLQTQTRRAAVSVAANIAEGAARNSAADFARFLAIALGSLAELDTELRLCEDLQFVVYRDDLRQSVRTIRIMLSRLRDAVRKRAESR